MAVSVDDDTNDDDFSFERSFRQKGWSWAKYTAEIGELILLPLVVLLAFMPTPELLAAISLDGLIGPIESVRVAGGTWAAYARFAACVRPDFEQRSASITHRSPRKQVLRLRSLVARGRARTANPIIEPVFRLPNEMCWHVLKFWRATCATTGEVL